jgi:hypothetical protein
VHAVAASNARQRGQPQEWMFMVSPGAFDRVGRALPR